MDLSLSVFLIVCPFVFLAGFVDSIGGGGGLISLPAYFMAGIPPQFAIATNKLSAICGAAVSSVRYYRNKFVDVALALPSIVAALIGSVIGSYIALLVADIVIKLTLLVISPVVIFYVFKRKDFDVNCLYISRVKTMMFSIIISFFVGAYDGFSGPGTGMFLILLYNGVAKIDGRTAAGNAKVVNLASNISSLIFFLYNGRVLIPLGICAGAFNMLGAYFGSGLVINKGTKIIRYTILIVLILMFVKVMIDTISEYLIF